MNTIIFKRLMLCLLFLSTLTMWAQERGKVTGKVALSGNTPAENISVALKGTPYGAVTNQQGEYEIRNVKPGNYALRVSAVGIKPVEENIMVAAGQTVTKDFTLAESQDELNELVIDGNTNRYSKKESVSTSRLPLKNLENAQVYNVVTKELMTDQLVTNQDDALKNVPGLYQLWGSTGRAGDGGSYFASRGFVTQALVRNGVAGTVIANNDVANVETIEAIKGPSATLFGNILTSYGGLINRVTKKPYETFGGEVSYLSGSFGYNRVTADINTPVNADKTAMFRLNTAATKGNTFQDYGMNQSFFFAPSFTYKFNDKLSATIEAEFFNQDATGMHLIYLDWMTSPSVIGIKNAKDLNYDFKRSLLGSDFVTTTKSQNIFATVDYKISDSWKSQSILTTSNNSADGPGAWLYLLNDTQISRNAWGFQGSSNAIEFQQNFTGDFNIGNMRNRLVIGGDLYQSKGYTNITYLANGGYLFDIVNYNGEITNYNSFNQNAVKDQLANSPYVYNSQTSVSTHSAYISDVLNITPKFLISAGVRFDNFENRGSYNVTTNTTTGAFSQNAFSPKFGAVYQIIEDEVAVFANYQNSFKNVLNPTQGSAANGVNSDTFKPEQANQFEAGVKLNMFNDRVAVTASYYDIKVEDIVRTVVISGGQNTSIQDGTQKSKGIEVGINANPLPGLNIVAGYAYNDSKLTKTDPSVDGLRPTTAGPQNLANLWISYKLPVASVEGLGIGFGGNYAGESIIYNQIATNTTGVRETFTLPSYTVLNASLFYDQPKYRLSLKVNNLTDELYFNGYTTINVQAPRNFMGSITYKF